MLSSSGPNPDTVARTGTPLPMPPRAKYSVTDASGFQSCPIACVRARSFSFDSPGVATPDRSPFMSAANTGTPFAASCSARPCSVRVLPVPVAPATSPCRFIMPSGMRICAVGTGSPFISAPRSRVSPVNVYPAVIAAISSAPSGPDAASAAAGAGSGAGSAGAGAASAGSVGESAASAASAAARAAASAAFA